jgi:hypothetical protein
VPPIFPREELLYLEAIKERWGSIILLVLVWQQLKPADEARLLHPLHDELLPKAKEYVTKKAIVSVGRAQSDSLADARQKLQKIRRCPASRPNFPE